MKIDLRLAIPAAACWLSAGILIASPEAALPAAVSLGVIAGVVVVIGRVVVGSRRLGIGLILATLAVATLSASSVAANAPHRQPGALVTASEKKARVTARILVESLPHPAPSGSAPSDRMRFRGSAIVIRIGNTEVTGSVPVVAFAAASHPALQIGDQVTIAGTLRSLEAENSASFLLFGAAAPHRISEAPAWLAWANELRQQFSAATQKLPGDGGDLLPGLAIGDTRAVSIDLDESMKTSALSHLTAVSGSNCAVITGLAMLLTSLMGLRRRTRVLVSLTLLAGFVILVTPDASVLRAALMSVIVIFSKAAGRPARGVPALAAVVIGLVAFDPWLSRNYGFALSVLATFGLLVLAQPLADRLSRVMPASLAAMIAMPWAAQLACQPVLILLNPTIPLYGVAANLLAEPAAPAGTVAGLIACVLMPWLPGLGFACAQVAWVPATWIASIAHATASLPGSQLPWIEGLAGIVTLSTTTLLVLVVVLWSGRRRSAVRIVSVTMLIVTGGAYAGVLLGTAAGERLSVPQDWQIAACDVGQGDAVVVRSGSSHALIDVGPEPASVGACLDRLGIDQLDLLVLSHFDADHVGGLEAVLGRVVHAIVGATVNPRDERSVSVLRSGGATVTRVVAGDSGTLGDAAWSVVWPRGDTESMSYGNEGSVVIAFESREMSSIFLGDLGEAAQIALLSSRSLDPVDVVKVAHHGSADQSSELYRTLNAQLGLISSGADNTYGHPTARLLDMLAESSTRALRTDERGTIVLSRSTSGDNALSVWSASGAHHSGSASAAIRLSDAPNRLVSDRRGEQWQYAKRVQRVRG